MIHDYNVLTVAHPPDVWSVATKQATKHPDGTKTSTPLYNTYPGTSQYQWTRDHIEQYIAPHDSR